MKTALYCCSSCHGKGVKHTHLYWHINCNLSLLVTQFIIISCYITRRVPLVEQELLSLPEHMNSTPVFIGVRVTRSLVLCACFVVSLFVLFSFGHCVVCPSSVYGFWLPLWYLQTVLADAELATTYTKVRYYLINTVINMPENSSHISNRGLSTMNKMYTNKYSQFAAAAYIAQFQLMIICKKWPFIQMYIIKLHNLTFFVVATLLTLFYVSKAIYLRQYLTCKICRNL